MKAQVTITTLVSFIILSFALQQSPAFSCFCGSILRSVYKVQTQYSGPLLVWPPLLPGWSGQVRGVVSDWGDIYTKVWDLAPDIGSLRIEGIAWQKSHIKGEPLYTIQHEYLPHSSSSEWHVACPKKAMPDCHITIRASSNRFCEQMRNFRGFPNLWTFSTLQIHTVMHSQNTLLWQQSQRVPLNHKPTNTNQVILQNPLQHWLSGKMGSLVESLKFHEVSQSFRFLHW